MDIYVHNRLCSVEVVGDIQISRIHKIHILMYQEAADEKHRLKRSRYVSYEGWGQCNTPIQEEGGKALLLQQTC